ncbi:MAG: glycosyltransferase [Sulfitobacter sp.]
MDGAFSRPLNLNLPKAAICTVCSDRFVPGLTVMLQSLSDNMRAFADLPVRVFYNTQEAPLGADNQARISRRFANVTFHDCSWHEGFNGELEADAHRPAFLALEAFRQDDVERVIYLDSDTLCTGELGELLFLDCDFAAVPCRKPMAGRFNSGLMVIGKRLLSNSVADAMITLDRGLGEYWADQPRINAYLRAHGDLRVMELPEIYNFMYIAGHPETGDDTQFQRLERHIKLVHWAGRETKRPKPWNIDVPLSKADTLWQKVYDSTGAET